MKALVYTGVEELTYTDRPRPEAGEDEALVRIMASGICGSDMHAYLGHDPRRPAPLTLGHEAAGVVVGGPQDGRRVTINPLVACQACNYCSSGRENLCQRRQIISMPPREGAFADYVAMPSRNLITVPEAVPLKHAALAEPIACGWHGVRLGRSVLGGDLSGARAVVIGGGAIGVGAALSLAAQGAQDIMLVEPNETRRARLADVAGFEVCAPGEPAMPGQGSADIVIDGVGDAGTRETASMIARPGGVIVHIGLGEATGGLDIRRMTLQEITFIGTYTYTSEDFAQTTAAIFDGRLGRLDWIEERPLAEGHAAFQDIRAGCVAAPKIILTPDHGGTET
ncbi:alcohol dehydrogenase catalytic domain-containing protein [Roseobacter sinensis]|uniref:Alcohol dehydrogenase catalytic domain-containing protein n=1 Tax=Roseobacter sinensis TaxID=2931391 RepID=A0ABT3BJT8_9RHOB|nr:alcohol dehydrogenase catalytic domain-containing protein [Roseobacter sp. WL0113]MCV3273826.1 alcohol dehydrogenase catalytic domain-containing protein [Roseobacter sp. WL0113]